MILPETAKNHDALKELKYSAKSLIFFHQGADFLLSPVIENTTSPLIYKYTDCLLIK